MRRGVFWSQNLDVLLTSPSPDFPLSDQMKHFCSLHWDSSHLSRRRIAGQHKILSLMVKACLFHPAFAWSLNPPFPGSQGIDWCGLLISFASFWQDYWVNSWTQISHFTTRHSFQFTYESIICVWDGRRPEKAGGTVWLCNFRLQKWAECRAPHLGQFQSSWVRNHGCILDLHFQSDP